MAPSNVSSDSVSRHATVALASSGRVTKNCGGVYARSDFALDWKGVESLYAPQPASTLRLTCCLMLRLRRNQFASDCLPRVLAAPVHHHRIGCSTKPCSIVAEFLYLVS